MEIIVEAELDGYRAELGMTREMYDTARLSSVSNLDLAGVIDHNRKAIAIQARKKFVSKGRANIWVDFGRLNLKITREVDKPPLIRKKGSKAKVEITPPSTLSLFDGVAIQPTKPDPCCGCTG